MRTTSRSLFVLLLVLALALFAAGCGDDDDGGSSTTSGGGGSETTTDEEPAETDATEEPADAPDETFQIQVKDGQVIGGPQAMKASAGDDVRIEILSDAKDEAHLHGIDAEVAVPQGSPAVMEFTVEDPGSYELEFHDSGLVLGSVVVS